MPSSSRIVGVSDSFHKAHELLLSRIRIGRIEAEILSHFRRASGVYPDLAALIGRDPNSEGFLLQVVHQITAGKTPEPVVSAQAAMAFLGFESARNLVSAFILKGRAQGLVPGSPELEDILRFSLMSEKQAGEDALRSHYFVAGLAYDAILAACPPEETSLKDRLRSALSDAWIQGRQAALIASQLARGMAPDSRMDADLVLDGLLHSTGQAVAQALQSTLSGPVLSYLIASRLGFASESAWVALYQDHPLLAARIGKALRVRATLIWIARRMGRYKSMAGDLNYGPRRIESWRQIANQAFAGSRIARAQGAEHFKELIEGISL